MADNPSASVSSSSDSSAHARQRRRRIGLVIALAAVVVLVLLSAFVWPHWAVRSQESVTQDSASASSQPPQASSPKATAAPLPDSASELLKAMPDTVGEFARVKADSDSEWSTRTPIEEYNLVYSTGRSGGDVSLHLAQWSRSEDAKALYDSQSTGMSGKELASGNVRSGGTVTGSYLEKADGSDEHKALVIWQNDTVVFRAQGQRAALEAFYKAFPL
ncbi:hypothetical protein J3T92_01710 [Bifidobacterium sp. B4081]|uniref:hypothetical protein n=1 Tax=unclassified Bifidobacterium TaxID=2608897 RepID=UPI00226AD161|nr:MULTISPECIES: hypothetical protein [unclassified Bifidobacterium]MCX8644244.1 hypothetical protein [Bifidobacterium sp. B4077]MCX8645332.1 hypothetical protein [Bifidobacterium sp. B4081]MCX8668958.1 hypothetical protein [Bifidobacterium sp. B3998]MCX8686848.1 hypothetical protein [Bifidobacterium sp. B4142]